ncbi:MAG: hypothetical protein ABJB74_03685 [Gemmatimonas sp.]
MRRTWATPSPRGWARRDTKKIWMSAVLAAATMSIGAWTSGVLRAETSLAGDWKLEFRTTPNPADLQSKTAPWLTFIATLVQVDSAIGASMRSDGPSGQFGCKRRADDACSAGKMRLSWDEQDWQLFEFQLTPGSTDKGTGRAEIRFPTGQTDRYTFTMTRVVR